MNPINKEMKPINKVLYDYFKEAVEEKGNSRYLFDENNTYGFKDTMNKAVVLANKFYSFGMREGAVTAFRSTRTVDTVILLFALQFLGVTAALIDPHECLKDIASKELNPDFILTDEDRRQWRLTDRVGKTFIFNVAESVGNVLPEFDMNINVNAPALVIFTSGSTGKSKGVVLSQYNYMNHIRNYSIAGCYYSDDISIHVLPVNHVFGLAVIMMGLYCRYQIFFPENVKADYIARCIEKFEITRLDGVPSFALAISEEKMKHGYKMPRLRTAVMGGAPVTREQFDYIEKVLGVDIVPVYGMSECIGISGVEKDAPAYKRATTVGKFLPMCEGKIACDNEICVKAPSVMLGYWKDENTTAQAIDKEGFLHTGDLGYVDKEGYLHISGRKKDIIIRNGKNISAIELENKIIKVDVVKDAAVVGLADKKCGEVPAVAAVLKDGCNITMQQLYERITAAVNKLEAPVKVIILSEIPLTPSGKKDKQAIKALFDL